MTLTARVFLALTVIAVSPFFLSADSPKQKPTKSAVPLSADEIAVYKIILRERGSHEGVQLNVSATTFPLDIANPVNGWSDVGCLKGIRLEDLSTVSHSFHELIRRLAGQRDEVG